MDLAVIVLDQILTSIASLILISIGLAVIFGMMRVINLAHGEFIMLGGYTVITSVNAGVNLWFASLVLAPLVVGAFGFLVERTIVRFLYGRMIDTMLATWGLSLAMVGAVTMIFGNTTSGVSTPLGSMAFGRYELSNYNFALMGVAIVTTAALWAALRFTPFGIIARATMQNAQMVGSLGVNSAHVYAITFTIGAALSGLAGGMIAPLSGVLPSMGVQYVAKAFITVISGGSAAVAGTAVRIDIVGHARYRDHVSDNAGLRGSQPVDRCRPSGARHAARDYRQLVQGLHMTFRNSVVTALCVAAAAATIIILPHVVELFTIINATIYASMAILTLSLALVWGFCGIISFGQTAFFGLGGYAYAVAAINFGDSTPAIALALLVPTLFAGLLGYFIFWGRVTDVYLGVITLTVTLILYKLFNATAGDAYHIGKAALGGFNGIPATPLMNLPWDRSTTLEPEDIWYVAATLLCLAYAFVRWLLSTKLGHLMVAIRENEHRTELLGYDPRRIKLAAFTIGGAMAGASGILFANCVFVSPTMFSLLYTAQVIVWVIIGGLGTLAGPIFACFLLQMITAELGRLNWLNPNFVLGIILIAFVLLMPSGILPTLQRMYDKITWPILLQKTVRKRPAQ